MRPKLRRSMRGRWCRESRTPESTLTSKMRCHCWSSICSNGTAAKMPTLLTRMSRSGAAATIFATPSAVPASAATPVEPGVFCTASSTRSRVRPLTTTLAPSRASSCAMASPMPAVEPVTSARLPLSWRSISSPPHSTAAPSTACSSVTFPALGLFNSFSIFIASTTTRPWPSATSSPTFTITRTTLPGMGASTRCGPSALNFPPARRRRRRRSSSSSSACTVSPTRNASWPSLPGSMSHRALRVPTSRLSAEPGKRTASTSRTRGAFDSPGPSWMATR